MKKIILAFAALAAVLGFSAAADASPIYPLDPPQVTVDNPNTLPGGTVVLGVTGCEPGATITINVDGTTITAQADASGSATVPTTAPNTPGVYDISVTCGGVTTTIRVTVLEDDIEGTNGGTNGGGTTGGTTDGLPATGSGGTNTTMMLGLGALIVGGGLFGVSQIRRRQSLSA